VLAQLTDVRITIKVKLPESNCGASKGLGGKVVEIGVNPKLDDLEVSWSFSFILKGGGLFFS
jgi:hypothetical protein